MKKREFLKFEFGCIIALLLLVFVSVAPSAFAENDEVKIQPIKNDKKSICVKESASIPHDSFVSIDNLSNNANFNNSLFKSKSLKIPILDNVLTLAVDKGLKGISRLIDGM